ncbi:MAG TPA: UrcA family protein, partial [Caulobacteraceae bacterium]|nr:UrcA family protein [Caulobacteraceae bacterium]
NALGLSATFAAASILVAAAPANAQTDAAPKVTVQYADLDIGHASGANLLLERIKSASTLACGGQPDMRDLKQFGQFRDCQKTAMHDAVARIDAPMLTAVANHEIEPNRLASR